MGMIFFFIQCDSKGNKMRLKRIWEHYLYKKICLHEASYTNVTIWLGKQKQDSHIYSILHASAIS